MIKIAIISNIHIESALQIWSECHHARHWTNVPKMMVSISACAIKNASSKRKKGWEAVVEGAKGLSFNIHWERVNKINWTRKGNSNLKRTITIWTAVGISFGTTVEMFVIFSARMARCYFIDVILKMTEKRINQTEMRIWGFENSSWCLLSDWGIEINWILWLSAVYFFKGLWELGRPPTSNFLVLTEVCAVRHTPGRY